jgi:four helix bundle protein
MGIGYEPIKVTCRGKREMQTINSDVIRSHRDLIVWQKAMNLVDLIYDASADFPRKEEHRLTSQLFRAVISVPSNIAEGQARAISRDFANFLVMAKGSLSEIDTQLTIAVRRKYISASQATPIYSLIAEVSKMIVALRMSIAKENHRH